VPCEERDLGAGPCVDVLFAWAPRFVDHVEMTRPLFDAIKPHVRLVCV